MLGYHLYRLLSTLALANTKAMKPLVNLDVAYGSEGRNLVY